MKVKVCKWHGHIYPYDVKTTGKHPVHMIEGGQYLTECETVFNECSDMGWFFLNTRDYNWFKENLVEIELETRK